MNKQIEEMAWDLCDIPKHPSIKSCEQCGNKHCLAMYYAKRACNNGYRKASDVAREIDTLRESLDNALKLLGIERNKVKKLQKQLAPFRERQCRTCIHYGMFDHVPCCYCQDYDKYEWLGDADLKKKYESEGAEDGSK